MQDAEANVNVYIMDEATNPAVWMSLKNVRQGIVGKLVYPVAPQ